MENARTRRRQILPGAGLKLATLALALLAPLLAVGDYEYEFIEVTPVRTRYRVAVPSFTATTELGEDDRSPAELTALMRQAVEMTGLFELIDPDAYPEPVGSAGRVENFSVWQLIRTDLLIRGSVARLGGDRYQVDFRLYDIRQKEMALGKRYTGPRDLLNRMVLRFMDEIIGWLTPTKSALENRIAYVSNATGRKEIRVMDADGSHDQALTSNRTLNLSPTWSPDGRYLLYTGYRSRNPDLYIADLKERKEWRFFSQEGLNIAGSFSPDGRMIAFSREGGDGNVDVYLIETNGRNLKRLTTSWSIEVSPTWSPDGNLLAFVSDRTGSNQIYLLDLNRGPESERNPAVRLTSEGSYNTDPCWAPNGKWIAYTGRVGGQFDLFLIDMTGTQRPVRRLTATHANEEDPSWSPDSRFLVYTSNKYGNYDIFLMSIYGGTPKRLTKGAAREIMPAWSPRAEP